MNDTRNTAPRGYGLLTAEQYRNQVIRELIEKARDECLLNPETGVRGARRPGEDAVSYGVRLKHAEGAVEWLKSQIEEEELFISSTSDPAEPLKSQVEGEWW